MVLRLGVGGLVMIGDDGDEIAGTLVFGDEVELAAPEIGEKHRVVSALGDGGDRRGVELLFEHRFEGDFGPLERERGDGGARQPVGVDM